MGHVLRLFPGFSPENGAGNALLDDAGFLHTELLEPIGPAYSFMDFVSGISL